MSICIWPTNTPENAAQHAPTMAVREKRGGVFGCSRTGEPPVPTGVSGGLAGDGAVPMTGEEELEMVSTVAFLPARSTQKVMNPTAITSIAATENANPPRNE